MGRWTMAAVLVGLLLAQPGGTARAEVSELRMATQFGIGAMAMIIMQKNQVLERRLAAAGLADTKVTWRQFPGGNPMVTDAGAKFTTAPTNVMTFAEFMFKQGLIKTRPDSWKDMFFPELYALPGS